MDDQLTGDQIARAANPELIAVHVPLNVLWDYDSMTKLKRDILGRLGGLACTSGFDIRWKGTREFIVNPALDIRDMHELAR